MKTFDVQAVELDVSSEDAFDYISDPARLPAWTSAFAEAKGEGAVLRTPEGEVNIGLVVEAAAERGTVDWRMTFPDGSVAVAYSRVVPIAEGRCAYTFVLTPPPVPLERLEGALAAQSETLKTELRHLKHILERHEPDGAA